MSIGGTASRKITGQEIMNASKLNVGSTPIVSGTVGRVLFEGTGNVLQQSSGLTWDNTSSLLNVIGVGKFNLNGTSVILNNPSGRYTDLAFSNADSIKSFVSLDNSQFYLDLFNSANYGLRFWTNNAERMRIPTTGNILIGTTTDAGFRLDVNGTARVQDNLTISKNQNLATRLTVSNTTSGTASISEFTAASNNGDVSFGKFSTLRTPVKIINGNDAYIVNSSNSGDIAILNDFATGRIKFAAGGSSTAQMTLFATGNLGINTTTDDGFRLDVNGTARVQSKLTIGNSTASLYQLNVWGGATESYISLNNTNSGPLNTDGFQIGLEANGTDVYFINRENGFIQFRTNNLDRFRVANTGNVLINTTTDAGFKLDVNGSVRTKGEFYVGTTGSQASLYFENSSAVAGWRIYYASTDLFFDKSGNQFTMYDNQGFYIRDKARIGGSAGFTASAVLDLVATNKGFLPPRMTNAQRTAIVSPAVGLIVYCTDVTEGLWVYKSTGWTFIV
jgi:hypothetical protein